MLDVEGHGEDLSSHLSEFEHDHVEATLVTGIPTAFAGDDDATVERHELVREMRDFSLDNPTQPARPKAKGTSAPAALAANIHVPAVSELRKPRPSRRTPAGGSPTPPNVLHAIVSAQVSEPMPVPRPAPQPAMSLAPPPAQASPTAASPTAASPSLAPPTATPAPPMSALPMPLPAMPTPTPMTPTPLIPPLVTPPTLAGGAPTEPMPQLSFGTPGGQAAYSNDASGLPMAISTPPGMSAHPGPGVPPHLQPYGHMQGAPGYAPPLATQMSPHGYPQLSPSALYQFQPQPQPELSLTGQMRLLEVDELPPQYRLGATRRRWFTYIVSGTLAVVVAAAVTFVIIRSIRETTPSVGSIEVDSMPGGADVYYDDQLLLEKTPLNIGGVAVGSTHVIRVELPHHGKFRKNVDMPREGGTVPVTAQLTALRGKIMIDSIPSGAEISINGVVAGRTPASIPDVDIDGTNKLELRLKDYRTVVYEKKDLVWSSAGSLTISKTLTPTATSNPGVNRSR
jgi:hypothetical protein